MKLFIILAVYLSTASSKHVNRCSTCVHFNGVCHNTTLLFNLEAPFRNQIVINKMGILRSRNTLYYSFEPIFSDPEYYKVAYINLDNNNLTGIVTGAKTVLNLETFDIDQENNIIYFGGSEGIYKQELNNDHVSFYAAGGDRILSIFFKGNIFFVTEQDRLIRQKIGDNFRTYEYYKNIKKFVMDKKDNILFLNSSGLYLSKINSEAAVYLSGKAFFRGLVVDLDGVMYAWWIDGIYKVVIGAEFEDSRLVKVADIPMIGCMTFDNDNRVLLTSDVGVFMLTPTNQETVC